MLLGAHRIRELDGELVKIKKWVTHPDAKQLKGNMPQGKWLKEIGGAMNDISIVVLSKSIKFANHVLPACLPSSGPHARESNKKGYPYASGWGTTKLIELGVEVVGVSSSNVPKRVQLSLTSENQCNLKKNRMNCDYCDRDEMLCAYGLRLFNTTVMEDSCGGDSGGNILIEMIRKCTFSILILLPKSGFLCFY